MNRQGTQKSFKRKVIKTKKEKRDQLKKVNIEVKIAMKN
jgi:hypothetical protein